MDLRKEILQEAAIGKDINPEWVALQTVRLYRDHIQAGVPEVDALRMAKLEMIGIKDAALRVRKQQARRKMEARVAPWIVIALGALACFGWWQLWE